MSGGWLREALHPDWAQAFRIDRLVHDSRTGHQRLRLIENARFGRVLTLDDVVQVTTGDEFIYHEMMAHVPVLAHGAARRVLIVGGGDGGSAEELLKHPSIKSVTLAEIDLAVVDISRKYLRDVHRGALDDPRLTLKIGDGFAYVRESAEQFDLVVLDLTDAGGPSLNLYTPEFYRACAARLAPMGALTLHIASPVAHPERIRATIANLRTAFPVVAPYLTSVPLYGGLWMMACCSALLDPRSMTPLQVDRRIAQRGLQDLAFYNGDTHRAAFALPNFVRALVA